MALRRLPRAIVPYLEASGFGWNRSTTKNNFSCLSALRYPQQHKLQDAKANENSSSTDAVNRPLEPPTTSATRNISQNRLSEASLNQENTSQVAKKLSTTNGIGTRYLSFLERYQDLLGKKFPGTLQVYRIFVVGFKDFVSDVKDYLVIKKKVVTASDGVKSLTRAEMEIYFQMPKDMLKVGPVLLLSALPLAQYLVFPIAYYFPRHLLSSHFWTLQQKFEFAIENHRQRVLTYRPLLRQLQSGLDNIKDENLKKSVENVLNKLGSGSHPTTRQIMAIKPVFESEAFSLQAMHGPHAKGLCRILGVSTFWRKRRRLYDHAYMLSAMDSALLRHGIFNLKTDELKLACYMRGLNASNITRDDLMAYLQQWMSISSSVKPHAYSLLLHLPILLSYNHPNNWALLKPK